MLALTLLANLPIAIGLAVQRWRQGSATARLYLVGFGLVLGSVGVMRATALVQPTSANAMVFPLALTLEALLFSLALASRIQDLKQERAWPWTRPTRKRTRAWPCCTAPSATLHAPWKSVPTS